MPPVREPPPKGRCARASCFLWAACCAWPAVAAAQNLDIQHGRAAPGDTGLTFVQGAAPHGAGRLVTGLQMTYVNQPLRLFNNGNHVVSAVVQDQLALVPTAAYGVLPDLDVSASWLVVPVETLRAVYQNNAFVRANSFAAGAGDLWLDGKYTLLRAEQAQVDLAVSAGLRVPVLSSHYLSDGGVAFVPRLLASRRLAWFLLAAEVGVVLRKPVTVDGLALGQQMRWAVGVAMTLEPLHLPAAEVRLEAFGLMDLPHTIRGQVPEEMFLAGYYRWGDFSFTAGGGRGLTNGYGAPVARVVVAASWAPSPPAPPPPPPAAFPGDADSDGILDPLDACPDEAEDYAAPNPTDGCTKPADHDGDGIDDDADDCPDVPGDANAAGCPPKDTDHDGIPDPNDKCPEAPEDKPGADADGCPELDQDKDGIPDDQDKCPEQAEVINGNADEDGCPDDGKPPLVELKADTIEIKGTVFFGVGKDNLLPRAFRVLDQLASLLHNHRNVRIRVEGYSDASGSLKVNLRLSKQRAEAVRRYLIDKGIEPGRIETTAMGQSTKYGSAKDARGRALNRRVIIKVIRP